MLKHITLTDVLCIDIETVPQYPDLYSAPAETQQLWNHKAEFLKKKTEDTPSQLYARAGIYAEFGKIICISTGTFEKGHDVSLTFNSFYDDDEASLLHRFAQFLNERSRDVILCAHNGKEFDFPYICRRMIINAISLPHCLQLAGKKPWEVNHLDTMELWKFGDYKHYTPLSLLARILDIQSPKDDIHGGDVHEVYWQQKDLLRIVRYCEKDVITVMKILQKLKGEGAVEYNHDMAEW